MQKDHRKASVSHQHYGYNYLSATLQSVFVYNVINSHNKPHQTAVTYGEMEACRSAQEPGKTDRHPRQCYLKHKDQWSAVLPGPQTTADLLTRGHQREV